MENSHEPVESQSVEEIKETEPLTKPRKSNARLYIGLGVLAVGVVVVASFQVFTAPTALEQVVEDCGLSQRATAGIGGISLDDDGRGLFLDGQGESSTGVSTEDISCVLFGLDIPQSVVSRMDNTNSLMGQQEASWDKIRALWTYHPNSGFDVSLELE